MPHRGSRVAAGVKDDVSAAFSTLSGNVNTDLATALSIVLTAIQGLPDYSAVMAAIQQVLARI